MPEFLAIAMLSLFVGAFVFFAAVAVLRSAFRINDMVRNQERIIAELQRLNDNHSSSNSPS